ncbi:MAG TPA: elongation factor G [Candidatus Aminicenantes bacterium]|nr:elongation factor G [Candidatus Aminicenantes bacterium]HOS10880.1 elongation factor G [Candidatus Aminicenantes bacterium]HPL12854.1 elongation factor G [Candidatus Aminicenantes bacterium]
MKAYTPDKIRNLALTGHGAAGKTSLAAAMLFNAGVTTRLTKVDKGNTITDFEPEEIERKISISSALCVVEHGEAKINVVDTPGYSNFLWDTRACLRAVDAAVVLVDAVAGVEVGTEKVWDMLEEYKLPRALIVNKMDRENAHFAPALESIRQFFGRQAIPVQIPLGEEKNFRGVVDLLSMKACVFEKDESGKFTEAPVPAEVKDEADKRFRELVEMIAEGDEKLMETYLDKGELSPEEILAGLKAGIASRQIFPVFAAAGGANIGVQPFCDRVVGFLPSPLDRPEIDVMINDRPGTLKPSPDGPFAALVFKTISDPYTGRISMMRVFSGKMTPDGTAVNPGKEIDEKFSGFFFLQGKEQAPAGAAVAGDILATAKLKATMTGDTLAAKGSGIVVPPITFAEPAISFAIEPKTRADEDRISQASQRLVEEDPTIRFERDPDTNQLLISGGGELHVRIVTDKLKKRYNVDIELKPPKVSYKETIKGRADVQGRHKKQTGGRGQFGDVWIKMEPLPRGKDFEFEDKIFGGSIPRNFIPSVEKGLIEAKKKGVLAGFPVVDFKVILYDGSYHEVDSSDIAFKIAASKAFKLAMQQAKPTILEPVMNVEVYTPEAYMGDIMGNLNGRRGRVSGMEQKGQMRILKATVPMSEMLDFEPTLTSITGGRGSFLMEYSHMEEVPAHLQQKIIAEAVKEGRVKTEEE